MGYKHHAIYVGIVHGHDVLDFEVREGCRSSKSKAGLARKSAIHCPTFPEGSRLTLLMRMSMAPNSSIDVIVLSTA
jgi:hypothetical protein